jgi:hypothetical protein
MILSILLRLGKECQLSFVFIQLDSFFWRAPLTGQEIPRRSGTPIGFRQNLIQSLEANSDNTSVESTAESYLASAASCKSRFFASFSMVRFLANS